MAMNSLLYLPKSAFPHKPLSPPTFPTHPKAQTRPAKSLSQNGTLGFLGAGLTLTLTLIGPASAAELPLWGSLQLSEPSNALFCPPGPYTFLVSLNGLQQWLWCGSMGRSLGLNLGKGCLGVWFPCLVEHYVHAHGISFITPSLLRSWWLFKQP
ncbi:ycf49-like protein [Prunus yedoensis var. nudiflora]|uniref:Ycf49-like protein n=1 Tax=Prunus yedoensis var. nudiflora TaxID=2094558 RepID=A0A314YF09_PRUYE|nr:ycf49-like protein [Prunus yedoensis var. nudiflora]